MRTYSDMTDERRLKFLQEIDDNLTREIAAQGIKAEVTGRAKHLYSIYKKMKRDQRQCKDEQIIR